jgi:hypothetical protein
MQCWGNGASRNHGIKGLSIHIVHLDGSTSAGISQELFDEDENVARPLFLLVLTPLILLASMMYCFFAGFFLPSSNKKSTGQQGVAEISIVHTSCM